MNNFPPFLSPTFMHNLTLPKLQFFHNHISIQTVSYITSIAKKPHMLKWSENL